MAERVGQLPRHVVDSFRLADPNQRVHKLEEAADEIAIGMLPVIGWLERRRSPGAAELVKRRMFLVLNEAVACAGMEIPEYAGGTIAPNTGEPSTGAMRTATLVVHHV
jgi:hypothetical protein